MLAPVGLLRREPTDARISRARHASVVFVHLGTTAAQLAVFAAVWFIGARWVFLYGVGVPNLLDLLPIPVIDWFIWIVVRVVFIAWIVLILLAAIAQCSYVVSLLSKGRRSFLWLWSGLMLAWGAIRILPPLADGLAWLPPFRFQEFVAVGDGFELQTTYYESGPYAAALLLTGLFALATARVYRVVTSPSLPPGDAPPIGATADGEAPRRVLHPAERVLIVVAALSLAFVYDVASNGDAVRSGWPRALIRRVVAHHDDLGFTRGVPFVASQGSIDHPASSITTDLHRRRREHPTRKRPNRGSRPRGKLRDHRPAQHV